MNNSQTVGLIVSLKDQFSQAFQRLQKNMIWTLAEAAGAWYALGRAVDVVTNSFNNQYTAVLQLQSISSQLGYSSTQLTNFANSFNGSAVSIQEGAQLISQGLSSMLNPGQIQQLMGPGGPLYKLAATMKGSGQTVTQAMMGVMQGLNAGSLGPLGALTGLQNTRGFYIQRMVIESLLSSPFTRAMGIQKAMELINQSAGRVNSQFKDWNTSLEGAQERLNATWENAKAQLGRALAPLLIQLVELMTKFALAADRFIRQHPEWVKWGGIMVAAGTAILTIVAALSALGGMLPVAVALAAAMALVVKHLQTITDMIQGVYQLTTKGAMQAALHDRLQSSGTLGAVTTMGGIVHGIEHPSSILGMVRGAISRAAQTPGTGAYSLEQNYEANTGRQSWMILHPESVRAIGQAVSDSLRQAPLKVSSDSVQRSVTLGQAFKQFQQTGHSPIPGSVMP